MAIARSSDQPARTCAAMLLLALAVGASGARAQTSAVAPSALESLLAEGNRQYDASRFREAIGIFEEVLCRAAAPPDDAASAKAWHGLSRAQWALGENAQSLASEERALALQPRGSDPDREATMLNSVGLALYSTGAHAEALDYYNLGLERATAPATRALLLLNVGLVLRYQGRFAESEAALQESLALRRAAGKPRETALTLNALGMLARITGQYARAIAFYDEALALRRAAGDRFGEAQTLNNLANAYGDQGEPERALALHRQTLGLADEIAYTRQIGLSHENIGAELDDLGRPGEALPEACAAIALYRKTNDRSNLASTLSNAGGYSVELGEPGQARMLLDEALAVAIAIGEPEMEIVALKGLAEADLAEARPADALERLDTALLLAGLHGFPGLEWKLRLDRARALDALGRKAERIADLAAAADAVNDLRAAVGTDAGKIGFLDQAQEIFEELAVALSAAGRDAEALETAESSRARALADLLSQRPIAGKAADRAALGAVRGAQARARRSPAARGGDLGAALSRLRQENPELASLVAVESPRIEEIRRTAARLDATFIEYLAAKDACYVWVVAPDGALHAVRREMERAQLSERVRRVREELQAAGPTSHPSRALTSELTELGRLLVAPIEQWLPQTPERLVVIVPHGPLALVPFAALPDGRGRPFLTRHTFALAPAASVFRYTAAKGAPPLGAGGRALVVADPAPPKGSGLDPLPGARREAARVANRLGGGALVLTGARATEAEVKRVAPEYAVLHFATHGLISEDRPLESSLLLAQGDGDDGYLRVDEIFGLDLHASLVVLSGCRTGLGRLSGEGILGFTRAFLYAGTPSIVVSQWDVSDRATVELMDAFYAAWRAGRGKAQALRQAELSARQRHPHPAVWAAFVLVGEPR
ncbi:MAG TPA: CHAT domain-containing protein [Thermoanaerobaculia bacterium]